MSQLESKKKFTVRIELHFTKAQHDIVVQLAETHGQTLQTFLADELCSMMESEVEGGTFGDDIAEWIKEIWEGKSNIKAYMEEKQYPPDYVKVEVDLTMEENKWDAVNWIIDARRDNLNDYCNWKVRDAIRAYLEVLSGGKDDMMSEERATALYDQFRAEMIKEGYAV